jgi:hypothetical protein
MSVNVGIEPSFTPDLADELILVLVLGGYLATLLVCMLYDAQLRTNANRAGKCRTPSESV